MRCFTEITKPQRSNWGGIQHQKHLKNKLAIRCSYCYLSIREDLKVKLFGKLLWNWLGVSLFLSLSFLLSICVSSGGSTWLTLSKLRTSAGLNLVNIWMWDFQRRPGLYAKKKRRRNTSEEGKWKQLLWSHRNVQYPQNHQELSFN